MQRRTVHHMLDELAPGARLDLDDIDAEYREEFLAEFEGLGYELSSDGVVGEVLACSACDGDGLDGRGEDCAVCDGWCVTIDYGKGKEPYRDR